MLPVPALPRFVACAVRRPSRRLAAVRWGVLWLGLLGGAATAQTAVGVEGGKNAALDGVGIDEKLGAKVPRDLEFFDDEGRRVRLAAYFTDRPVLVTMNYSSCPMLCNLQLNGLFGALGKLKGVAGRDFEVLSVSFDPTETPFRGRQVKERYGEVYRRPEGQAGVHFLTGDDATIRQLADALGIRYKYLPEMNEFSHAAVVAVVAPDGTICRYVHGVQFEPEALETWLAEAEAGTVGDRMEQILAFCYGMAGAKSGLQFGAVLLRMAAGAAVLLAVVGLLRRLRRLDVGRSA